MALEREKFLVYLQEDGQDLVVHQVTIHHVDLARGEKVHTQEGGGRGEGINLATAWCWAALTRMGLYAGPYSTFRDMDCVGLEDDGKETVDPTQPPIPGVSD